MIIEVGGLRVQQFQLPVIPELQGLQRKDHVAFVVRPENEEAFATFWETRGLQRLRTLVTQRYPARHTGFIRPGTEELMVALSVSDDPSSPINRLIQRCGEHSETEDGERILGAVQHLAYVVDTKALTIEQAVDELRRRGITCMTPVLTHLSGNSSLKQVFVTCDTLSGMFLEIVERTDLPIATPSKEQGFSTNQIDELYGYLDRYYESKGI